MGIQKVPLEADSECPAIIGTVPIYDAVVYYHKTIKRHHHTEWLDIVEMHAKDGVDFRTIHGGINKALPAASKKTSGLPTLFPEGPHYLAWMEMRLTGKSVL